MGMYMKWMGSLTVSLLITLSGCASLRELPQEPVSSVDSTCIRLLDTVDRAIDRAGTRDSQAGRIAGFPFLRVNRFLASFRDELSDTDKFNFWIEQLQAQDMESRRVEIRNTPEDLFSNGDAEFLDSRELLNRIRDCGLRLRLSVTDDIRHVDQLLQRAVVPDAYSNLKRFFGIYPLSRLLVKYGIEDLQQSIHERFQQPQNNLPVNGKLISYFPPVTTESISIDDIKHILEDASRNPLGIPLLSLTEQNKFFNKYAPTWEIDVVTDNDRIGTPYWQTESQLAVDIIKPHVYRHLSYTRFGGESLVQLNYVIWFPARTRSGHFDILSGHIDGITWRVTLGRDGHPVFYDSMHNCGCYHLFFPADSISQRKSKSGFEEDVIIPEFSSGLLKSGSIVIRVASGTHYLQRIDNVSVTKSDTKYMFSNYDDLRSITLPSGHTRSMFGPDGLVAGTERMERWLLWPMGILAPGSMRQWGHHATAFIGRRHFDDPDLFDRYFEVLKQ